MNDLLITFGFCAFFNAILSLVMIILYSKSKWKIRDQQAIIEALLATRVTNGPLRVTVKNEEKIKEDNPNRRKDNTKRE